MKKSFFILFLIPILLSCSHNDNKAGSGYSVNKEVMDIAIKYAMDKFKEAKKTVEMDGIVTIADNKINYVTIGDNQVKYVIDPARIFAGLIDEDSNDDAMVSIDYYHGQYLNMTEHLILIKTNGKFMLNRVIESDMKIMGIKDRVITAEISTRSRNSPLRDCSVCKEIVKYQFRRGDLIRIE
ncbi:MAG: hypothetical protein NTX93_04330 [Bacteroidia bacterium]|nr:hypothetical protein [Bacteroidia bacterium]